jgi:hypothetical protein
MKKETETRKETEANNEKKGPTKKPRKNRGDRSDPTQWLLASYWRKLEPGKVLQSPTK